MKYLGKTAIAFSIVLGLSACGNSETGQSSEAQAMGEEDTAEIVVAYYTSTEVNMEDTQQVQDAINDITLQKINTQVTLLPISIGSWSQQINLMISGGDQLDLVPTFFFGSGTFDFMRSSNQLMPLNDLLEEYGQDILKEIPSEYFETTTYDLSLIHI